MKRFYKAFLGCLALGSGTSLLISVVPKPAIADEPMTMFDVKTPSMGEMTFSGAGTALYNQQSGTTNSVNAGTSSNLSFGTSLATSPHYGGSASITVGSLNNASMTQAIGVKNTGVAGAQNSIDGVFKASIQTSQSGNKTSSNVDISGIMSQSTTDAKGANIALSTGSVDSSSAPLNGSATASASINSGTSATAAISASQYASGFMQAFQPKDGLSSITYDNGQVDTNTNIINNGVGNVGESGGGNVGNNDQAQQQGPPQSFKYDLSSDSFDSVAFNSRNADSSSFTDAQIETYVTNQSNNVQSFYTDLQAAATQAEEQTAYDTLVAGNGETSYVFFDQDDKLYTPTFDEATDPSSDYFMPEVLFSGSYLDDASPDYINMDENVRDDTMWQNEFLDSDYYLNDPGNA
jgi:hypothetical protein